MSITIKRDVILLDLDGTIIDSYHSVLSAIEYTLTNFGIPIPNELYHQKEVGQLLSIVERKLPSSISLQTFKSEYDSFLLQHPLGGINVRQEMAPFINSLKENGYKLIVLTNKRQAIADIICSSLFPEGTFLSVIGRKTSQPLKPSATIITELLKLGICNSDIRCLIGDSDVDRQTAALLNSEFWNINSKHPIQEMLLRETIAQNSLSDSRLDKCCDEMDRLIDIKA